MPYDPSLPANNTQVRASELRGQFQGLHELITALQAVSGAVVDATDTLPAGQPATANVSLMDGVLHFSFSLPQGLQGPLGPTGEVGWGDLANALLGTSSNSNGVSTLDTGFADPDAEALRQKLNELILSLRRA